MPPDATPDFLRLLGTLSIHDVEFIIVGGVCGALHGAPVVTFDLDLVHSRSPENVGRLLAALEELDARYRDLAGRVIRPERKALMTSGHQLLITSAGPLDLLGTIAEGRNYAALLPDTIMIEVPPMHLRVLSLEALIREKEALGRDKDRATIPVLRNTLRERGRK